MMAVFALSLVFLTNARATDADTFSSVVSYQFQDSLSNPDTQTTITSPVVSYQYYDWPGDENLTFQTSPTVSYYYEGAPQITTQPLSLAKKVGQTATFQVAAEGSTPLTYQWRINGVNITGATGPTLTMANIQKVNAGNYSVVASNAYGSLASRDAALNVLVPSDTPLPLTPILNPVNTPLALSLTEKPRAPSSTQLQNFSKSPLVDPNKMTIVLTHGWNSTAYDWPLEMANALKAKYDVNILAWDWHEGALIKLLDPAPSANQAGPEGRALGKALMDTLGSNYEKPIHFIGHSLGTIVNCAAADYIHGVGRPRGDTRPTTQVYSSSKTQVTLLDQAELVTAVKGVHIALDTIFSAIPGVSHFSSQDDSAYVNNFWSKVIPDNAQYIDNYLSLVGYGHDRAVNALLWRNAVSLNLVALHGYSISWYKHTVEFPQDSTLGHKWSFERNTISPDNLGYGVPFPNSYFLQNDTTSGSEYGFRDVTEGAVSLGYGKTLLYPSYASVQTLFAAGRVVSSTAIFVKDQAIQYYGYMQAKVEELFAPPPGQPVSSDTAGSTTMYYNQTGTQGGVYQSHPDLQFSIEPGASNSQKVQVQMKSQAMALSSNPTAANAVYSIIPVHVPREAVGLTFEYMVEGAAVEDYMKMGINTENKLTTGAKYLTDTEWNGTPMMNITDYVDQDVELVFALNGTDTPPTGKLSVRNIQFYIPERPQLALAVFGAGTTASATASWPISAIDWTLETTTDLTSPNWQPVAGAPDDTDYFHTVTFDLGTAKRTFFRLRK